MMFKSTLLRSNITPLELRLLVILQDWERSDANLRQLTDEINFRKYYSYNNKKKIKIALMSLVEQGYVKTITYKGNIVHYILDVYLSD